MAEIKLKSTSTRLKKAAKIAVVLQNKLLMLSMHNDNQIIMFSNAQIEGDYFYCDLFYYDKLFNRIDIYDPDYIKAIMKSYNLNLLRENYLNHIKMVDAMQKLEADTYKPNYMDIVHEYLKQGKTLMAIKEYKLATDKSLNECKEFIMDLIKKHYPNLLKD